jgi:membrane-associated phospholipid phosphatase
MNGVVVGRHRLRTALLIGWIAVVPSATLLATATRSAAGPDTPAAGASAPAGAAPTNPAAAGDTIKPLEHGLTPADVRSHPPVPHLVTPHDLWFLGATVVGTTIAITNDRWLTDEAIEASGSAHLRGLSSTFRPLGNPMVIMPVALGFYGVSRWIDHPELARRSVRLGLVVGVASVVSIGLKEVLGRSRPYESPEQSNNFKPFSGHNSFPSGHASTAFAAAVALDRETTGRWVPYVVYPAAAVVAWSRVLDQKHWTSDVVGGAAIGGWTAWKVETFLAHRALGVAPEGKKTTLMVVPRDGAMQLVMVYNF